MKQVHTWAGLYIGAALLGSLWLAAPASAQMHPLGWGLNADFQAAPVPTNVMAGVTNIAAGYHHSLAVKNGQVWGWGLNTSGQTTVPVSAQSDVKQVAGGEAFSLALKSNGAVVGWGAGLIATNIPAAATSGVSQIAAGEWHALALKNGGVIAWGSNSYGQCAVPAALTSGVSAIAGGGFYSMALKDGGVQIFGIPATNEFAYGIRDIPAAATSGVTAIAAGRWHALALKNGGVIAWGATNFFDPTNYLPSEVSSGVAAISAGDLFSMALKTDGTIVVWGEDLTGVSSIPNYATNGITQIAAGAGHCLVIASVMPPRFTTATLPAAYVGYAYAGSITAEGTPAPHYYQTGSWPGWMTLDGTTGAIGGTPSTNIIYSFSVIASNAIGQVTNSYSVSVLIYTGPPVFVTTSPLPDGVVGAPYSVQLEVSNNPVFNLVSGEGAIPPGLTLSTNGLISGTPTTVQPSQFFTVRATNTIGASNRVYFIAINAPAAPPEFVTTNPLPSGVVGQPYSLQIVASNYPSGFILWVGSLPNGLLLGTNGILAGTPTQIEQAQFTIQATNLAGVSNRIYNLEILGPPVFTTTSPLSNAVLGVAYSQQIVALGSPIFSMQSGSLPNGLGLTVGGMVTGTATVAGPFNFTVRATNDYGWTNRAYNLTVAQIPVFSTTNPLPGGKIGEAYSLQIVASGSPLFSVVTGVLPGNLVLSTGGLLSGNLVEAGTFNFTVQATNAFGWSTRAYDLGITNFAAPMITYIRSTNNGVRIEWTPNNVGGKIQVWSASNITVAPVPWTNLGVQLSPWTNIPSVKPIYYQLRIVP